MNEPSSLFRPREYFKPSSPEEAVRLNSQYNGQGSFIAGGTDLLVTRDPQIKTLIDVTGLGLNYIKANSHELRIGAVTTFAEIEESSLLTNSLYHIIAQAAHEMGTPQIRNRATIGGNICSAVPSADSAPALLVLDAKLSIYGTSGIRTIDITDFFQGTRKTVLEKGELLMEIQLPNLPDRTKSAFIKKGRVATSDLAVVNTAVRLTITDNGTCRDVRIALGAVAPNPLRAREAEAMLQGEKPQEKLLEQVAACAAEEINPISDVRSSAEYRTTLSRVLVRQALQEGVARGLTQN